MVEAHETESLRDLRDPERGEPLFSLPYKTSDTDQGAQDSGVAPYRRPWSWSARNA